MSLFPDTFQDILNNSEFFTMWQHSDIIHENIYNQVVFLGNTKVNSSMEGDTSQFTSPNNLLNDIHTQIFILQDDLDNNPSFPSSFTPIHSNKLFNFSTINSTDDLFKGVLTVDDYIILVNSNLTHNHNVYVFNVNKFNNVEYICFVKIGQLINPKPYSLDEINYFENLHSLSLGSFTKEYLTTHPKILKFNQSLFYINLLQDNKYISKPYYFNELTDINNNRNIVALNRLLLRKNTQSEEELKNNIQSIIDCENNFIDNLENGFLLIGFIQNNNIKEYLYLLVNNPNSTSNFDGSLWTIKIYDNENPLLKGLIKNIHLSKISSL